MNLLPQERTATKSLQQDDHIFVLPADKGKATVVMDKVQYDEKMGSLLADQRTYERMDKDPIPGLKHKMNAMLLRRRKAGSISNHPYNRLRCSAGRLPLPYGLPTVHKPEVPLHPIVHCPKYQLSKHPAKLLSPLVGNTPSYVWNSRSFVKFIRHQVLQVQEVLALFDVVSLFTNVPVDLALAVHRPRLHAGGVHMPKGGRSDGALGVLSHSHRLGVSGISVPAEVRYCNGVSSLRDDLEPGDGGRGGESSYDSKCATPILEAVC